ncbi:MAG: hypothetical protein MRZ29_00825 [Oscillospiraceae bacterium]|nr:hypothetical protein [Oscillospiraceae bacterium]
MTNFVVLCEISETKAKFRSVMRNDSHPAIIAKREFDILQAETERRKKLGSSYSSNNILAKHKSPV